MTLLLLFRSSSAGSAGGTAFESFVGGGMYLGRWGIDDWMTFAAQTHDDTGAAADADAAPSYAIYEDETAAAIVTGNMAKLGAVDGFYTERVQLTAASGFEAGKAYTVRVAATVGGVVAAKADQFCLGGVTLAATESQVIRDALKLAPSAGAASAGSVDAHLDTLLTYGLGGGSLTFTYTVTSTVDATPIADVTVEVYSDVSMSALVAQGVTNASGVVTFYLDAGTYYLRRIKAGYTFPNPDTEVVS